MNRKSDGNWACYWDTAGEGSHVVSRHASRELAERRIRTFNKALRKQYPGGNLLCGYELRVLRKGSWVRPADDDMVWDSTDCAAYSW